MLKEDINFLLHYGVKGMQWGVRKDRKGRAPSTPQSADHKRVAKLRTKPVSSLSNQELSDINKRLNLEQNYAKLNPGTRARGKASIERTLSTVGLGVTAYNLAFSPAGKASVALGRQVMTKTIAGKAAVSVGRKVIRK